MIALAQPSRIINSDEWLLFKREGTTVNDHVIYVDGKPVKRDPELFHVKANVQPVSGRDLLLVPEGDRYREMLTLYCDNFASGSIPRTNDKVFRDGKWYQVQTAADWGSYSNCRIMLIDVGPDSVPFDTNP